MRRAPFALIAALLCGCPLAHAPPREQVVGEALPDGTSIPPAFASPNAAGEVANDWLASFDDPDMRRVVQEAIAHNPDLRAAAESVEIARQNVTVVGAALLPQVGAKVSGSHTYDEGDDHHYDSSLEWVGVAWEIDVWGRLRAERAAAQAQYQASALDYAFARQSLAATTAKSWYLAIETRRLLALAQDTVAAYRHLADLVGQRYAAGKVGKLDVAQAGASLSASETALRAALSDDLKARRALELLIGRYPDAEIQVAPSFPPSPPAVPAGLPAALLERRPDLVAAEQGVLAAFREHESAELALLPSFSLSIGGGHFDDGILSLLRLNPWMARGTLGVDIPIYEGGAMVAQIQIADAEQTRAVASYGSAVLQAFGEAETALSNERLLAEEIHFADASVSDRTRALDMMKTRYLVGATDLLAVIQTQTYLIETEAELLQLRYAALANRIDLHLAIGGSFDAASATGVPQP